MSLPLVAGFRLSPPQRHLWQLHGNRVGPYRVGVALTIAGRSDPLALRAALHVVAARHESLRTAYRLVPGMTEPMQVIETDGTDGSSRPQGGANAGHWSLEVDDLQQLDPVAQAAAIDAATRSLAEAALDLDAGPVWRARLLRQSPLGATLLLTWPAIVADIASVDLIVRDLARAVAGEGDEDADDEPMQHVDVTEWQHELLESDGTAAGRDFWRQLDRDAIAASRLSLRRRSSRGDAAFVPRTVGAVLPADICARATRWAEARGYTVPDVLEAAWLLLMSRLTESDHLVIGCVSEARALDELAAVVGPIGRTLPVRCPVDDRWSFAELVARGRDARADHLRWHALFAWPLLDDRGHVDAEPFCPLAFGAFDWSPIRIGDHTTWTIEHVTACADRVELMTIVTRTPCGWRASWSYDEHVHTAEQVACVADQYLSVLRRVTIGTGEGPRLAEIDVRGERESARARERLAQRYRARQPEANTYPRAVSVESVESAESVESVQHLIRDRARETPDREAVVCDADGERLTYGELQARAERLAGYLRAHGVGPETRVGVFLEHSCDLLVALLGTLNAGAAFVPLPPGQPIARLASLVDRVGAPLVITHRQVSASWPSESPARLVRLDAGPEARAIAAATPLARPVPVAGATLAYVMFTSGSTGEPKGVMVPHGALAHYVRWSGAEYLETRDGDVLLHGSIGFDATLTSVFVPLCEGARVVIAAGASHNPEAIASLATPSSGSTRQAFLKVTPSHLGLIAASLAADRVAALTGTLVIGGEALHGEQLAAWQAHARDTRIVNEYGPTEATVGCIVHEIRAGAIEPGPVPIGHPIPGVPCHAFDRYSRPAAVGVAGELYIGGAQLARGYEGRADLTAERFVPDPLASEPGARCYRTGDLVYVRPDGALEYAGRRDQQIKLRGHRVELGEVEAALRRQPGIQDAVAIVREDTPGDRRLVAYVVAPAAISVASDRLQQAVQATLPDYMVPASIVRLDALPVTPNGKVDRGRLPAPDGKRPALARAYVAPRTDAEATLARIWAEVLGVDRVGVQDNFFALGGDSILSLQIVARAGRAGLRLAPRLVFEHQTIEALAATAIQARASHIDQGPITGSMPLTPIQHWFFDQALDDPNHYNQALALDIAQPIAPRRLEAVWRRLQVHHDALRLRYRHGEHGSEASHADVDQTSGLQVIDASDVADVHRLRVWERIARDCQCSLHLEHGPIARAALVQWDAAMPQRLLFVLHHIIGDGLSWRVLLEDFHELCRDGELPPKTTSFTAWSEHVRESAGAGAFDAEAPFWIAMSEPSACLPCNRDIRTNTVASQRTRVVTFDADQTAALLQRLPVSLDVRIQDVVLAGIAGALARWTGERIWRIDLESHGRDLPGHPGDRHAHDDVSRTIGWFTCVYPVRLTASRDDDPIATLRDVRAAVRRVPRYGTGYGPLRYLRDDACARPLRDAAPPEIIFNYWGQLDQVFAAAASIRPALDPLGPLRSARQRRSHVFEISASVIESRLQVTWTYSANLHDADTIDRLTADLRQAVIRLSGLSADARASLQTPADFPLSEMTQAELDHIVAGGGPVADIYPLSPLQDGLLFHWLYEADRAMYIQQFAARIAGPLDADAFRQAWQITIARHDILRTGFAWERQERPLQIVRERAELPWTNEDWRGLDPATQDRRLSERRDADRRLGFSVEHPPLMRVALTRQADDMWHVLWTSHHLILDGWSMPIVMRDVLAAYAAVRAGREPWIAPPAGRFADYVGWLQRQDMTRAEQFWRRALDGFSAPALLASPRLNTEAAAAAGRDTLRTQLPAPLVEALQALGSTHGITMNTWCAGAWGLLVARCTRRDDVVFGAVVSGRPADLPGADQCPGLFVNSLPMRVRVAAGTPAIAWFAECQRWQVDARDHEYTALARIQSWSAVPAGTPLFDTLFVYENYPVEQGWREQTDLRIEQGSATVRTTFPIEVEIAGTGSELNITLTIDASRTRAARARFLRDGFQVLLARLIATPESTIGALAECLDEFALGLDASEVGELRTARQASLRALRRAAGTASSEPQFTP